MFLQMLIRRRLLDGASGIISFMRDVSTLMIDDWLVGLVLWLRWVVLGGAVYMFVENVIGTYKKH